MGQVTAEHDPYSIAMDTIKEIRAHAANVAEAIFEDGYEAGIEAGFTAGYQQGARAALDTASLTPTPELEEEEAEFAAEEPLARSLRATLDHWAPDVDAWRANVTDWAQAVEGSFSEIEEDLASLEADVTADAAYLDNIGVKVDELFERVQFLEQREGLTFTGGVGFPLAEEVELVG